MCCVIYENVVRIMLFLCFEHRFVSLHDNDLYFDIVFIDEQVENNGSLAHKQKIFENAKMYETQDFASWQ